MTLIVSVRVSDGVVLASDDLATEGTSEVNIDTFVKTTCPNCHVDHDVVQNVMVSPTTKTRSRTVKIFPLLERFGIGFSGVSRVDGKSLNRLVPDIDHAVKNNQEIDLNAVALFQLGNFIADHLHNLIKNDIITNGGIPETDFHKVPAILSFQIVGWENNLPTSYEYDVGGEVKYGGPYNTYSCSFVGAREHIIHLLNESYNETFKLAPIFENFSIYEAIEYATFVIRTASAFQQYSSLVETIGYGINAAVIDPHEGFKWVNNENTYGGLS